MKPSNGNLLRVVDLARKLLFLADRGDMQREDDGCGVLYGVLRDSAYRMKYAAEREIEKHRKRGLWEAESDHPEESAPGQTGT